MEFPISLETFIVDAVITENNVGHSSSKVFLVENNDKHYYLKVGKGDVYQLYEKLMWLEDKLPTPKVIAYDKLGDRHFLLMSEIKGLDLSQQYWLERPIETVSLLARSLKLIHSVDISDCTFDMRLSVVIDKAKYNVDNKLVDTFDFEDKYMGYSAEELYKLLIEKIPSSEELVLTHGDYCLPNIIGKNIKLSGFIDLDRVGIGCKYKDIALCIRSIEHNFNDKSLFDVFFKEYGIINPDINKIEFYILLDEFF